MAYKRISPRPVVEGGTGAQTLTSGGVLIGSGTSAIQALAVGANGRLLIGSTGAAPAFAALTTINSSMMFTSGANTLALDVAYAEASGSFTPVLLFGGASTGITYSTQTATWARMGQIVFISVTIVLTSKGTATGTAIITGLPSIATANTRIICAGGNMTYTGEINALVSGGSITLGRTNTATALSALSDTNFNNNSTLSIAGSYRGSL